ncbi:MAG: gliding motility lipoprotein GldH [Sphingobacteriaceae bacterium]|nr:gliding motility lipoprotein GldH [Sphingobacteriaceae bacterium]
MKKKYWLIIFGGLLLTACDDKRQIDVFYPVADQAWYYNDVKVVEVENVDTVAYSNVFLNLRHAGNYEWQNLYLRVKIVSPSGDSSVSNVSFQLTAPDGRWLGNGLGDILEYQVPFKQGIQFKEVGTYRFELEQYMRVNPLYGIHDVGLRIEKAK